LNNLSLSHLKAIIISKLSPPHIHSVTIPGLIPARRWKLSNGLPVVAIGGVEAPVLRVEMIWNAGRPFEPQRLLAGFTDDLLTEGIPGRSAADLEAFFEQFGTSLQQPNVMDTANLSLSTIHRHAPEVLPVMAQVIAEPAFTEAAFSRALKRSKQRLRENLSDNDTLAFRFITESIFGDENPYGYNSTREDYDKLTLEGVKAFYKSHYHAGNATLFVIGNINKEVEGLLEANFGSLPVGPKATAPTLPVLPVDHGIFQTRKPKAQQTMIRMGRGGIDIKSPDYPGLIVLDTIFGGYFGSRLMKNIREEKGYTYGIESDMETYRNGGSFGVSADVANENLADVRREIRVEVDKLLQTPVPAAEMDMVRAYLLGSVAMELDGPFGHGWRHRSAIIKDYEPASFLTTLDETIREISTSEIQDLAQRYLAPGKEFEVIIGGADLVDGAREVKEVEKGLR
jgi:predicted Zn-dependent peptidase